jgi:hypothetical protein
MRIDLRALPPILEFGLPHELLEHAAATIFPMSL